MRRSLLAVVLCVIFGAATLQAQRGGGGHGGGAAHGGFAHAAGVTRSFSGGVGAAGFAGRGVFPSRGDFGRNGFVRRGYWNGNGNGYGYGWGWWPGYYADLGYGLDWDLPYWDYVNFPPTGNESAPEGPPPYAFYPPPQAVAALRAGPQPTPVESPKLIEVPLPKGTVVKPQPPALFVLTNGEKLESRRYVLSAESLQIDVNRKQRTIPISQLNVDATIAANQERGIELSVPQDRSSLFVGF